MLSLFKKSKKKNSRVVVDFGSSSVGLAHIDLGSKLPMILWSKRFSQIFLSLPTKERFLQTSNEGLKDLAVQMSKEENFTNPEKIICFLSSYFCQSETLKIDIKHDTEFMVTESLVKDEIDKALDTKLKTSGLLVIEKKIQGIKLNGYEVAEPFDKNARELEISLFVSYTDAVTRDSIMKVLNSSFSGADVEFHTSSFALYEVLRSRLPKLENFSILNTSGEVTDAIIVYDSEIANIVTFNIGYKSIIRNIAEIMSLTPAQARTILELYTREGAHYKIKQQTTDVIEGTRAKWQVSFNKALEKSYPPRPVYLAGDILINNIIKKWLMASGEFPNPLGQGESLQILGESFLDGLYGRKEGSVVDVILIVECIFTNKIN